MVKAYLSTKIDLINAAGAVEITLRGEWCEFEALAAAVAYLDLLSDIQAVRVQEELPWGETVAHMVYRGPTGPEIQQEMQFGAN